MATKTPKKTQPGDDEAVAKLLTRVQENMPLTLQKLAEHVRIPSISADPERGDDMTRSAQWVADQLNALDCPDVQIITEGGQPAVIGRFPAPEGQPTVCLYAHHDVQPTGDEALWTDPPFEIGERDGRWFGRGVTDDKAGIACHLAALRAFDGQPPVGVTLFSEGEEEVGSPSLATVLSKHRDLLEADVFVIADSGNWDVGQPSFTTTLRGLADCVVEVSTLDHALHSGQFGGVTPDALTALCRLLATLHDDAGNVAIEGLTRGPGPELEYPEDRLRQESGVLDGVEYLGDGPAVERLWTRPAVSVIALDATPVSKASNTLAPTARAKVSLRVAPGDDAERALGKMARHFETHAPWGAHVEVTAGDTGQPSTIPFEGSIASAAFAAFERAYGVAPNFVGQGGSIPMVAEFQEAFPDATVLVTALCDPDSRMHGIDESLNLNDFAHACQAEALWLHQLAEL